MDVYAEQTVLNKNIDEKRKRNKIISISRYVLFVFIIVFFFLFLFSPMPTDSEMLDILFRFLFFVVVSVPFVVGIILLTKFLNKSCEEFDYYLNGGVFRIVRVIKRVKRKLMLEVNVSEFESIGRVVSETHDRLVSASDIKKNYAICDTDDENNIFYIFYKNSGVNQMLYICPDEQMSIALRRSISRFAVVDKSFNAKGQSII